MSQEMGLYLSPGGSHAEKYRADHQQDADKCCPRCIIHFPKVDASRGKAYTDGNETKR
jgi:hypothetical protein